MPKIICPDITVVVNWAVVYIISIIYIYTLYQKMYLIFEKGNILQNFAITAAPGYSPKV